MDRDIRLDLDPIRREEGLVVGHRVDEDIRMVLRDVARYIVDELYDESYPGMIGYFPTYALGNLFAAQLWARIEEDIPDLKQRIEGGQLSDLLGWLRENVHRHGAKFEPMELLTRVTGSGLTAQPYLRYLRDKFGEVYRL